MVEKEQVRPLSPTADDEEAAGTSRLLKTARRKKCIGCCGCAAVAVVLVVVVFVILIFTVFKAKDPIIKMNGVYAHSGAAPGANISLTADISVKNPNFVSFRYKNTTTSLYYEGTLIGEARGPSGRSKARRTMRMNVTIDLTISRLLANPHFQNAMTKGFLTMGSHTRVGGRINMMNVFKRYVIVRMDCTMTFNITSREIQKQKCKEKVNL